MMETVNIHQAKTHFSRLVERAEAGEEIIIARSGKPVARLVPISQPMERRVFGQMRGLITVSDDFDDPLPDDLLAAFYDGPVEPQR
jgi:prevent-host-death family protein